MAINQNFVVRPLWTQFTSSKLIAEILDHGDIKIVWVYVGCLLKLKR